MYDEGEPEAGEDVGGGSAVGAEGEDGRDEADEGEHHGYPCEPEGVCEGEGHDPVEGEVGCVAVTEGVPCEYADEGERREEDGSRGEGIVPPEQAETVATSEAEGGGGDGKDIKRGRDGWWR